ncbi:hypothetical protein GW915_00060 [bacterium]|nr:hypothetical protein [bacterium]
MAITKIDYIKEKKRLWIEATKEDMSIGLVAGPVGGPVDTVSIVLREDDIKKLKEVLDDAGTD